MTSKTGQSQNEVRKNNHRILCVGEVLWDMLPAGPKAGGAPMNVALHLKKFGLDVKFAGRVGSDRLGNDLINFLKYQGLDISLLQVDPDLPTSTVAVHLEPKNQVRFEIVDNVAWDRIELTKELLQAANEAGVIIYGTLASRHAFTRESILGLLDNDCLKLIDVNLRFPFNSRDVVETLLKKADIAKLNNDELKVIAGWYKNLSNEEDLVKWFTDKYKCKIVCITRGEFGALVYQNGRILEHPGFSVRVVDTVGSGDAFLAGFLSAYLSGKQLRESLKYACATGALVAAKAGGTPEYGLDEINKIIETN
jgi:fructokinase